MEYEIVISDTCGNGDGSDFHKRNINKKQNSTNKYKIMW